MFPFQDLDASVAGAEEPLLVLERVSQTVRSDTSPAGAERIRQEVEDLRENWLRLRRTLTDLQHDLRESLDAQSRYEAQRDELARGIERLRALVLKLSQQLEVEDGERSEENVAARWRIYTVRSCSVH